MIQKQTRPFSDARKSGNMIFVAGQIPKDMETGEWGSDIVKQTQTCLSRIKQILADNGAEVRHIVKTTVFLTNIQDYAQMNQAYVQFFHDHGVTHDLPARSVVEVGQLMYPEWFIELDCIAVISST